MGEDRCELSELPVNQCAHCKKVDLTSPTEGLRIARYFTAVRDSRCEVVETHRIYAGDTIGLVVQADDVTEIVGWACIRCVEEIGT